MASTNAAAPAGGALGWFGRAARNAESSRLRASAAGRASEIIRRPYDAFIKFACQLRTRATVVRRGKQKRRRWGTGGARLALGEGLPFECAGAKPRHTGVREGGDPNHP